MMKRLTAAILLTALALTGCSTGQRPSPPPAEPTAATQPTIPTLALPKLDLEQIESIELFDPQSSSPSVNLYPDSDGAAIGALAAAVTAAGTGRQVESLSHNRLTAFIRLRNHDALILSLPEAGDPVQATWQGKPLLIDSPALSQALAALEPELARVPQPGFRIWAVDPEGKRAPELLREEAIPATVAGISPDGRYLLLVKQLGEYKGDFTAIPYLLDRTTGKLTEGQKTSIRFANWSGRGFYTAWLTHLDLQLQETRLSRVEAALALKEGQRQLIATTFSADGKRFAALVGPPYTETKHDLVLGNTDGSAISVLPEAVTPWGTQIGNIAHLAFSPDGKWLAINGRSGGFIMPAVNPAPPQHWTRIAENGLGVATLWAPDSRHLWFATGAIYDLNGKELYRPENPGIFVWRPDGQAGVVSWYTGQRLVRLDGTTAEFKAPGGALPAGFLPDGRLLVWRTIYSR